MLHSKHKHSSTKLHVKSKSFKSFDDCLNACFNYESMRSRLASHPNKLNSSDPPKQEDLVPITFGNILYDQEELTDSVSRVINKKKRKKTYGFAPVDIYGKRNV